MEKLESHFTYHFNRLTEYGKSVSSTHRRYPVPLRIATGGGVVRAEACVGGAAGALVLAGGMQQLLYSQAMVSDRGHRCIWSQPAIRQGEPPTRAI